MNQLILTYLSPPQFFLPPWGVIFPRACSYRKKKKKKRQAYKCMLCRNSTPSHSVNSSVFLVLHSCYLTTPLLPLEDLTKLGTCWTGSLQPFLAHRHWRCPPVLAPIQRFSFPTSPRTPNSSWPWHLFLTVHQAETTTICEHVLDEVLLPGNLFCFWSAHNSPRRSPVTLVMSHLLMNLYKPLHTCCPKSTLVARTVHNHCKCNDGFLTEVHSDGCFIF